TVEALARRLMPMHAGRAARGDPPVAPPPRTIEMTAEPAHDIDAAPEPPPPPAPPPPPPPPPPEIQVPGVVRPRFNTAPASMVIRPGTPNPAAEASLVARRQAPPPLFPSGPALAPQPEPEPETSLPEPASVARAPRREPPRPVAAPRVVDPLPIRPEPPSSQALRPQAPPPRAAVPAVRPAAPAVVAPRREASSATA